MQFNGQNVDAITVTINELNMLKSKGMEDVISGLSEYQKQYFSNHTYLVNNVDSPGFCNYRPAMSVNIPKILDNPVLGYGHINYDNIRWNYNDLAIDNRHYNDFFVLTNTKSSKAQYGYYQMTIPEDGTAANDRTEYSKGLPLWSADIKRVDDEKAYVNVAFYNRDKYLDGDTLLVDHTPYTFTGESHLIYDGYIMGEHLKGIGIDQDRNVPTVSTPSLFNTINFNVQGQQSMNGMTLTTMLYNDFNNYYKDKGDISSRYIRSAKVVDTIGVFEAEAGTCYAYNVELNIGRSSELGILPVVSMYGTSSSKVNADNAFNKTYGYTIGRIDNLSSANYMFAFCDKLTGSPVCGDGIENTWNMYRNCFNLTGSPVVGKDVKYAKTMYFMCNNLTGSPVCPDSVETAESMYESCTNITGSPVVGSGVINAGWMYAKCSGLTGSPVCPDSVIYANHMYDRCTGLTGSPIVGAGVANAQYMYDNTRLDISNIFVKSNEINLTNVPYRMIQSPDISKGLFQINLYVYGGSNTNKYLNSYSGWLNLLGGTLFSFDHLIYPDPSLGMYRCEVYARPDATHSSRYLVGYVNTYYNWNGEIW